MDWTLIATFLYLVSWAIVFVMLWVVPAQRQPASATAWLLFAFFLPYLAVLAFLLIDTLEEARPCPCSASTSEVCGRREG